MFIHTTVSITKLSSAFTDEPLWPFQGLLINLVSGYLPHSAAGPINASIGVM
jgi:hypothetical protein